jgi:predicted  nucleic acid-binding Zn-ribbon protein
MPHQCTNCGRAFEDGSKEMLSGCPNCGGTTFQFRPDGADAAPEEEPPDPPDPAVDGVARTVGNAATAVKDFVARGGSSDARPPEPVQSDAPAESRPPAAEDDAQASARSETISPDTLAGTRGAGTVPPDWTAPDDESDDARSPPTPDTGETSESHPESDAGGTSNGRGSSGSVAGGTDGERPDSERTDRPDLAELREELNDQFESIRVIEPGQYELNLMELYDREEYIIALQEDGKYTIQVPDRWTGDDAA